MATKEELKKWRKRKEKILLMREEGKTLKEIGRILGVSKQRIHQIVRAK